MITSTYETRLADSLPEIQERITNAVERSGRGRDDITLVAVTKAHPIDAVHAALAHGLFHSVLLHHCEPLVHSAVSKLRDDAD